MRGLPCRITIVDDRGALAPLVVAPDSRLAARPGVVYTPDGRALIGLPPGRYTVSATRGFEYGLDTREVHSDRGPTSARLDLAIRREVPTEGLVACDTHVHTLTHSGHGDATLDERAVTLAGEGIELPIATDHDHLTSDLAAAADRMGVSADFTPVVGDEVTTKTGHFNAFPFPAGTKPPDPSIAGWPDLLRAIRSAPGERVVVLNHPRDLHAGFRPFAPEQFNPVTGEHRRGPLGVDAVEVINSGAMQSDPMQPVRDWMALRNRGERMTAVGASDSHDVARYIVGQGRTYIACRDDDPARLDVDAACRALKAGRALVSLGLLARMSVDDRFGVGDLATKLGEQVRVSVEVHGPSWSTADRVELFANGVKVREARIDPSPARLKARVAWTLPRPPHDVSLVAVASGPGVTAPYWAIARPYQPTSREWTSRVVRDHQPDRPGRRRRRRLDEPEGLRRGDGRQGRPRTAGVAPRARGVRRGDRRAGRRAVPGGRPRRAGRGVCSPPGGCPRARPTRLRRLRSHLAKGVGRSRQRRPRQSSVPGRPGPRHAAHSRNVARKDVVHQRRVTNRGTRAEGLLMNVRMVNAVFEDRRKPDLDPDSHHGPVPRASARLCRARRQRLHALPPGRACPVTKGR